MAKQMKSSATKSGKRKPVKKVLSAAKRKIKKVIGKAKTAVKAKTGKVVKKVAAKKVAAKKVSRKAAAPKKSGLAGKKAAQKTVSGKIRKPIVRLRNKAAGQTDTAGEVKMPAAVNRDHLNIPNPEAPHPITAIEKHEAEKEFHQREEVDFRQENRKGNDALASRKNLNRHIRINKGRRAEGRGR